MTGGHGDQRTTDRAGWKETASTYALLPLRLFLGVTFVYAAFDKLSDSHYLAGAGDAASFYSQTQAVKGSSPIGFLLGPALSAPTLFGLLIAFGELAVGLGTLFGLWGRVAAAGGAALSATLWLTVSWGVSPYYLGNDLAYLFAWTPLLLAGTPYLSVDGYLAARARRDRRRGLDDAAVRRRSLLDGGIAAVALGGAGLLAGSLTATFVRKKDTAPVAATPGSTAPAPAASGGAPGGASGGASGGAKVTVAASSVPVGGSAQVQEPGTGDAVYIVQPTAGQYCGFSSICTHSGCTVNAPKNGELYCPCHGSKFNATTGAVITGPATKPLPKYTVTKNGDQLELGAKQS
ncbi:Rieske 2Fe-2S domain-containing protein [Kitasatospora terrestris]|uniref:Rieske domain-containing protein n=1 Tax=Kitasatospora terrestris TaxID=258051 RepID=A0ABP9DM00_9ACTN